MKKSKYNHITITPEGECLLYNVLSGALVELDKNEVAVYDDPNKWEDNPEFVEAISSMGFIVSEEFNEIDFVELQNRKNCMQSDVLSLTIAPTLDCMCCCPYCFEVKDNHSMSAATQSAVINAIEALIIENGYKRLDISWYGGEPLMAIDVIENLTNSLLEVAHKYAVQYSAYIITNGVLLTVDNTLRLNACAIRAAQVTIDGLKDTHDSLRPLKSGAGTFDLILSNVVASAPVSNFDINIRTNIGTDNEGNYLALKTAIDDLGLENVHTYAARREYYPHSDSSVESTCMSVPQFSAFLKRNGLFKERRQRKPECFSCLGESIHSFAIDSYGNVYKCWNEVGDTGCSFASISSESPTITVHSLEKSMPYLVTHCLDDAECKNCLVLPLCMGGCIYQKNNTGTKECIEEKYCLDDYVLEVRRRRREEGR